QACRPARERSELSEGQARRPAPQSSRINNFNRGSLESVLLWASAPGSPERAEGRSSAFQKPALTAPLRSRLGNAHREHEASYRAATVRRRLTGPLARKRAPHLTRRPVRAAVERLSDSCGPNRVPSPYGAEPATSRRARPPHESPAAVARYPKAFRDIERAIPD